VRRGRSVDPTRPAARRGGNGADTQDDSARAWDAALRRRRAAPRGRPPRRQCRSERSSPFAASAAHRPSHDGSDHVSRRGPSAASHEVLLAPDEARPGTVQSPRGVARSAKKQPDHGGGVSHGARRSVGDVGQVDDLDGHEFLFDATAIGRWSVRRWRGTRGSPGRSSRASCTALRAGSTSALEPGLFGELAPRGRLGLFAVDVAGRRDSRTNVPTRAGIGARGGVSLSSTHHATAPGCRTISRSKVRRRGSRTWPARANVQPRNARSSGERSRWPRRHSSALS